MRALCPSFSLLVLLPFTARAAETTSPLTDAPPAANARAAAPEAGVRAGMFELRLGGGPNLTLGRAVGGGDGLTFLTNGDDTLTAFSFSFGLGYLATKTVEAGFQLDFNLLQYEGDSLKTFGLRPFLKLNGWASARVNPFAELSGGVLLVSGGSDAVALFQGGLAVGIEFLIGRTWGVKVWSGLQVTARDGVLYEVPVRWGFFGYF